MKDNIKKKIETTQNKILRLITNSLWYIPNEQIRTDHSMTTIEKFMKELFFKNLWKNGQPPQPGNLQRSKLQP